MCSVKGAKCFAEVPQLGSNLSKSVRDLVEEDSFMRSNMSALHSKTQITPQIDDFIRD